MRSLLVLFVVAAAGCASQQKVATPDPAPAPKPVEVAKPAPPPAPEPEPVKEEPPSFNGATIHFAFNDSSLTPEGMETLRQLASTMRANETVRVEIAGHADERGTTEYNLALGSRRADAARRYLVTLGVPESRVSIISYGEEMPAVQGSDESSYAANRRGEIAPR